jgi:hypothetical protein
LFPFGDGRFVDARIATTSNVISVEQQRGQVPITAATVRFAKASAAYFTTIALFHLASAVFTVLSATISFSTHAYGGRRTSCSIAHWALTIVTATHLHCRVAFEINKKMYLKQQQLQSKYMTIFTSALKILFHRLQ